MGDGVLSAGSQNEVEGLVGWWTESLSCDGHHDDRITSDKPDEPFKTCNTASEEPNRAVETRVGAWIGWEGLGFRWVMQEF